MFYCWFWDKSRRFFCPSFPSWVARLRDIRMDHPGKRPMKFALSSLANTSFAYSFIHALVLSEFTTFGTRNGGKVVAHPPCFNNILIKKLLQAWHGTIYFNVPTMRTPWLACWKWVLNCNPIPRGYFRCGWVGVRRFAVTFEKCLFTILLPTFWSSDQAFSDWPA